MIERAGAPGTARPDEARVARAVESNGQLIRLALDLSPVPMWVHDDETGRFLAVNDRAIRHYGYSRERFLAMSVADLTVSAVEQPESACVPTHVCQRRADGTVVVARPEMSAIDIDGRPATLVVAIDVTVEHQALADSRRESREHAASARAFRKTEGRFRELFNAASDWYWEHDEIGQITMVSPNFETIYGISIAEILGKRLIDLPNAKIDAESGRNALAAIKARRSYRDLLYSHEFSDGRVIQVKTSAVPIFADEDRFAGYCGASKDVTALTEAERGLRESERQYRALFETAADWYFESDADGYICLLSSNYQAACGISAEDSIGKRLYETPGVSFEPEMARMAVQARRDKSGFRDFIYSRLFANGETHWFKTSAAPILGPDGSFLGYRGVGAEITKTVEAEASARLARRRLDGAISYVTQPFVIFDQEDVAIAFNPAFGSLHRTPTSYAPIAEGVSLQIMLEWQVEVGFYADGPDDEALDLATLLALHRSEGHHTYHLYDDRWMLVTYRRLPGNGKVVLWSDITAIKQAEAEKRLLEAQLYHSQRLEALGTLAGGAAHEINNALVPVIALTKLVARKLPDDSRERHNLDKVVSAAERSRDLVRQILDFSRKQPPRSERFDLAAVSEEALQLMRAALPASIRLEQEIAAVPLLAGDPSQIHQLVVNLVTNAAHAIGEAMGTIAVALRPDADGAHLHLSVTDTGCGMDDATRARIFEPFFTTKDVGQGTGLGLALVHSIVNNHGGTITVESTPGRGARFDIVFPLRQAA